MTSLVRNITHSLTYQRVSIKSKILLMMARRTTVTHNEETTQNATSTCTMSQESKVETVENLITNRKHWCFLDNFEDKADLGCMRTDVTLSLHQKKRNASSALDEAGVRVVLKENGKPNMHYLACMLDSCYREGREGTVVKLDKNGGTSNGSCHLKNAHEAQSERTKKMKRNSDEHCTVCCF